MRTDKLLWVVEDDEGIRFIYSEVLGLRYQLRQFEDLEGFRAALSDPQEPRPDLLIADLRLGDQNFLSFLTSPEGNQVKAFPFLVISSIDDLDVLRTAFDEGAIDYLSKPFGRGELVVKIERILKRPLLAEASATGMDRGDVYVDPTSLRVFRGEKSSNPLTSKEFQIFNLLHSEGAQAVPRSDIVARVWGEVIVTPKTLDVHLFNLRRKLSAIGMDVYRAHPNGYRLLSLDEAGLLRGSDPRLC